MPKVREYFLSSSKCNIAMTVNPFINIHIFGMFHMNDSGVIWCQISIEKIYLYVRICVTAAAHTLTNSVLKEHWLIMLLYGDFRWIHTNESIRSGMAVLDVTIPTGYWIQQQKLDAYILSKRVRNLQRARFLNNKVLFYFDFVSFSIKMIILFVAINKQIGFHFSSFVSFPFPNCYFFSLIMKRHA